MTAVIERILSDFSANAIFRPCSTCDKCCRGTQIKCALSSPESDTYSDFILIPYVAKRINGIERNQIVAAGYRVAA